MPNQKEQFPLVSAVIPTRNRPELVSRAVRSALDQTYRNLEVIVVVDGPDPATVATLETFADPRLRIVSLPRPQGGSVTRNIGVQNSLGEWIALLDDDDEWLPDKVQRQLAIAQESLYPLPIVSSRLVARSPQADFTWPNTPPFAPMADYLLQRSGLFQGDGLIQTSTLFVPAELIRACPFNERLQKHQDLDWLIRAADFAGVGVEFVGDPLVIWHIEENRTNISASSDWRFSMEWLDSVQASCSKESYASFLLTVVSAGAASQKDWRGFIQIFVKACRRGSPNLTHVLLYCGMWLLPRDIRRSIRRLWIGRRRNEICPAATVVSHV